MRRATHFRSILTDLGHRKEKNCVKKFWDLPNLKQCLVASTRRASFWASLKKFDFFAISKSS